MILLDNIFILAALYVVVRCVCKSMLPGQGQILDAGKVLAGVREDAPYAVWLLGGVLLLWVYGVVDAALDKGSLDIRETSRQKGQHD